MFTAFMFLLEVYVSEYIKMNEGQHYFMPRNPVACDSLNVEPTITDYNCNSSNIYETNMWE
jgi:hypothetical protein